jgi:hypothetical protein
MALTALNQGSLRTISDFHKSHLKALKGPVRAGNAILHNAGLIKLAHVRHEASRKFQPVARVLWRAISVKEEPCLQAA